MMDALIIGLHLVTAHGPAPEGVQLQGFTPGVYVRDASGLTVGGFRNSHGRASFYGGWTWSTADQRWSITVGGVSGYPRAPLLPLIVPSLRVKVAEGFAVRASFLVNPTKDGAHGVNLSIERGW